MKTRMKPGRRIVEDLCGLSTQPLTVDHRDCTSEILRTMNHDPYALIPDEDSKPDDPRCEGVSGLASFLSFFLLFRTKSFPREIRDRVTGTPFVPWPRPLSLPLCGVG